MPKRVRRKKDDADYTRTERTKSRRERIKKLGLTEKTIVLFPEDRDEVARYARRLYRRRGIFLN